MTAKSGWGRREAAGGNQFVGEQQGILNAKTTRLPASHHARRIPARDLTNRCDRFRPAPPSTYCLPSNEEALIPVAPSGATLAEDSDQVRG